MNASTSSAVHPSISPSGHLTPPPNNSSTDSPFLVAALHYASFGWKVFPLPPRSKRPNSTERTFKHATCDADQIKKWWAENPNYNVGVATGSVSGFFVIDIDAKSGGPASWAKLLAENGPLPPGVISQTTGGAPVDGVRGQHFLFKMPPGMVLSCTTGMWPGIDRRADGGYIVAPPSIHPDGGVYTWDGASI